MKKAWWTISEPNQITISKSIWVRYDLSVITIWFQSQNLTFFHLVQTYFHLIHKTYVVSKHFMLNQKTNHTDHGGKSSLNEYYLLCIMKWSSSLNKPNKLSFYLVCISLKCLVGSKKLLVTLKSICVHAKRRNFILLFRVSLHYVWHNSTSNQIENEQNWT